MLQEDLPPIMADPAGTGKRRAEAALAEMQQRERGRGQQRIVGGTTVFTDATPRRQPHAYYVQLRVLDAGGIFGSSRSAFTCGGCIVHAWRAAPGEAARLAGFWVATAAHCLDPRFQYQVAFWTGSGIGTSQSVAVALPPVVSVPSGSPGRAVFGPWRITGPQGLTIFPHPLFNHNGRLHYDVALVRVLLPPGEDLPPTLLNAQTGDVEWGRAIPTLDRFPADYYKNDPSVTIGFGLTQRRGSPAGAMQELRVTSDPTNFRRFRPDAQTRAMYIMAVADDMLQQQDSLATTCSGDSGGPLLQPNALPGWAPVVRGVLCCGYCPVDEDGKSPVSDTELRQIGAPSFYTRLSDYYDGATPEAETLLAEASVWRSGLTGIIARFSPTELRSAEPSQAAPDDVASEERWGDNDGESVWVEGGEPRSLNAVYLRALARLALVGAGAVLFGLVVVTALRAAGGAIRKTRERSEGGSGRASATARRPAA